MTLNQASWQYICEHYPVFAQNFLQEYQRCNGFIPYEPGFVYAIHAVGSNYYKIGKSVNPDRRLLQIAPQMPFRTRFVRVWHSYFMSMAETYLHRTYERYRTNGEWFEFDQEGLSYLFSLPTDWEVRYAYTGYIDDLLFKDRQEYRRLHVEFQLGISEIETLFRTYQESLDPGLPDDIKAIVKREYKQTEEQS